MNKINYTRIGIITCVILMTGLISCLKDKNGMTNFTDAGTPPILAELPFPGFTPLAFALSNQPDTIKTYVNITSSMPLKQDETVTLALDQSGLAAYNAANGTSFTLLDPSAYSIPSFKVTIKAGQNVGYLPIIIYSNKVDLAAQNAIPLKIVDASGKAFSQNAQSVIYAILVKNQYEGQYHATGYFSHPSSPRPIDRDKYLATVGPNTVETELGDLGTWHMQLTINPDNSISFVPAGAANPAAHLISGDPVYNNTYDPATQSFYLKYGYPNPATRIITEIIKHK